VRRLASVLRLQRFLDGCAHLSHEETRQPGFPHLGGFCYKQYGTQNQACWVGMQAGRVWRDGQKKKVYVYRFLTTGTIEEKARFIGLFSAA